MCIFSLFFLHLDRANTGVIFETCESSDGPVIFTGHSRNIWVDFVANRNASGRGFQLSFLTIEGKYISNHDMVVPNSFCSKYTLG